MAKPYATDVSVKGSDIVITVGEASKTVPVSEINPTYLAREFARGLKLRIDNSSAGIEDDDKKLSARLAMVDKIDFKDPAGGIQGGRKKETSEDFLARYDGKIKTIEDYQAAMQDAVDSVRRDEQSDVLVELSLVLSEIVK